MSQLSVILVPCSENVLGIRPKEECISNEEESKAYLDKATAK